MATPKTTEKVGDINSAILQVMNGIGYVQKEKTAGLNYSFAGEAALIAALRPEMIKAGITAAPIKVEVLESTQYETRGGAKMRLVRTRQVFRFSHAASGTYIDVETLGEGSDAGDKSVPKALTIGFKYALRQTFVIETGDDPDYHASVPEEPVKPLTRAPLPARKLNNSQGGVRPAVNEFDQRTEASLPEPEINPWEHVFVGTELYTGKFRGVRLADMPEGTVRKLLHHLPMLTETDIVNCNRAYERPELQVKAAAPKEAA